MQSHLIKPQLATLVDKMPDTIDWLHEIKYDGYRIIAIIENHQVKLLSRNQKDWTLKLPQIVAALKKMPDCILDGELIALAKGISSFELLQNEIANPESENIQYKIFDILYYKNTNVMDLYLTERKKILAKLFKNKNHKIISITDYVIGNGSQVFKAACKMGLEGIVAKQLNSVYQQKRTKTWLKAKCVHEQEFVIAGFTRPQGTRKYFGSLLLGYYKNNKLIYCGHVGTGFNEKTLASLFAQMKKLRQDQSAFDHLPKDVTNKNVIWIKPKLVAEIKFIQQTRQGILRAPSFLGLRLDKSGKEVKQEMPIQLTHAQTIVKVTKTVTKQQIADYYSLISSFILPYLKNRPLSLLRCPASGTACFFQKHITSQDLASLKKNDFICVSKKSDLMHLAQAGVVELHPWGGKLDNIDKPDCIVFDLDPGSAVKWSQVIESAFIVRDFLKKLNLISFVKTSGGKGLHIVVPIKRKHSWSEIKNISLTIAEAIAKVHPDLFTTKMAKTQRRGKIFIDYLRNVKGATAVAAYSLRARKDAPVSTPITWRELKHIKSSTQFNISNIFARLKKLKKDPWDGFFQCRQHLL
jgi:bifunctional non-homologous end joining protein LigD